MAISSGYTEVDGDGDYASTQLAYILGIDDVPIVSEDRSIFGLDEAQARATKQIADLSLTPIATKSEAKTLAGTRK
ncbi:MAG: hypothetical protein JKY94_08780 [Rhodobacteraceae bacterium]|nr:hypothetical protein [Paracoccaceae bacterium]